MLLWKCNWSTKHCVQCTYTQTRIAKCSLPTFRITSEILINYFLNFGWFSVGIFVIKTFQSLDGKMI